MKKVLKEKDFNENDLDSLPPQFYKLLEIVYLLDPYTWKHSKRVMEISLRIARQMNLPTKIMNQIKAGGLLHDIGKAGINLDLIEKPARLSDGEFKEIQRHPKIGGKIVAPVSDLYNLIDMVLYHHERFDGKGYPYGRKGEDIPVGARIMAVADTYDAMTSDRSYRKGLPHEVAVEEIAKNSGSQFDPEVVKIFMEIEKIIKKEYPGYDL